MEVVLRGSSPGATVAGILLITRGRQLGLPVRVSLLGDPETITPVLGPTVAHAPIVASCGIGREAGVGGTIVVPGSPDEPVLVSLAEDGVGEWFYVDRSGPGRHPATRAFTRLNNDPRGAGRHAGKELRRALQVLGMAPETVVLDMLFGAPAPPLTRIAMALRAGRAISPGRGMPITRYLAGPPDADPLPGVYDRSYLEALLEEDGAQWILDSLSIPLRDRAEEWIDKLRSLATEDDGRDFQLLYAILELASHLVLLPPHSLLPPLDAAEDGVAMCLGRVSTEAGDGDANAQLSRVFRFLGGRYVDEAAHSYDVDDVPAPTGRVERWQWFCRQARSGRDAANRLWPLILDPPQ